MKKGAKISFDSNVRLELLMLEIMVLKNGSKGSAIYARKEQIKVGIYNVDVKDVTGAGDSFDGAFLCGLAEGKTTKENVKKIMNQ